MPPQVLSNVVLVEILPVCGELLWVDLFAIVNTVFCCISLFQSAFSIMLEGYDGDHLVYTFLAVGASKLFSLLSRCFRKPKMTPKHNAEILSSSKYVIESVAGILYRQDVDPKVARKVKPAEDDDEERMRKLVLFESTQARTEAGKKGRSAPF